MRKIIILLSFLITIIGIVIYFYNIRKEKEIEKKIELIFINGTEVNNSNIFENCTKSTIEKILIRLLKNSNSKVQINSLIFLGKIRSNKAYNNIKPFLYNKDDIIKFHAINSLIQIREEKAIIDLKETWNSDLPDIIRIQMFKGIIVYGKDKRLKLFKDSKNNSNSYCKTLSLLGIILLKKDDEYVPEYKNELNKLDKQKQKQVAWVIDQIKGLLTKETLIKIKM